MIFAPIFIKIKLQQKKLRAYNAFITCTAFTWAHVMKFYEEKSCIFFICSIYCSQLIAVAAAVCSHSHNINREEKKNLKFCLFLSQEFIEDFFTTFNFEPPASASCYCILCFLYFFIFFDRIFYPFYYFIFSCLDYD